MASSSGKRRSLFCRRCQIEFLTYKTVGQILCPQCGRPVRSLAHRRLVRLVAVALIGVLVAALLIVFWNSR